MARRTDVTSREYKVMLRPGAFDGDPAAMRTAVDRFWADVAAALTALDIPTDGTFDTVKARRLIRFFDTDQHHLNADKYIVREREDVDTGEREVTLKFRHPDRYVAADRSMAAAMHGDEVKTKFEEDVKPPFVSVFSFSTTQPLQSGQVLAQLSDVATLFPGLAEELSELPDSPLVQVSEFTAREEVLAGAALLLGKRDIAADCALVVWYDEGIEDTTPVVVEFSFKYGDEAEDYRGSVARDAYEVLAALQGGLTDWVDPEPRTKTSFVYA